jgi:uncharacterized membrane protein (DUF2068 family)
VTEVTSSAAPPAPQRRELILRLIILEKLVRGILALALAIALTVLLVTGTSVRLHGVVRGIREHVTSAWAVFLADAVVSVTERRHLVVATSAIFLDGIAVMVEWYLLWKGHTWGEWLVVATTSSLIPFEIVSLVREPHAGRVAILLFNIAIVVYLVRHALRRRRKAMSAAKLADHVV